MSNNDEPGKIVDKINKDLPARNLRAKKTRKLHNGITRETDYNDLFSEHMENYTVETTALHRKLHSKTEAVRILRKQLETFRTERDQFKLMAETLQLRQAALTRSYSYENGFSDVATVEGRSSVGKMLHGTRERNIKLSTELEALKQKLCDLQGDIEILRMRKSNPRGTQNVNKDSTQLEFDQENPNGNESELLKKWKIEKSNLISRLEQLKNKNMQLGYDLKAVLDEKEELINERDAYRCKAHRLNHELLVILKANDVHQSVSTRYEYELYKLINKTDLQSVMNNADQFLDIDSIILENKYLHECLKNLENELDFCKSSSMKYKSLLDVKRKKSIMKLTQMGNNEEASSLTDKQIAELLECGIVLPKRLETVKDFKSLCLSLIDHLNDKNEALNHQKKTNKILAEKNLELEKRLQVMMGVENTSNESERFSIANYLLQGYNAALMDARCENDMNENDNNATNGTSDAESSLANIALGYVNSLNGTSFHSDEMTSLSSFTDRSILSSQYEITNCPAIKEVKQHKEWSVIKVQPNDITFADFQNSNKLTNFDAGEFVKQHHENQRQMILEDLPTELAVLVEAILNNLDAACIANRQLVGKVSAVESGKFEDEENEISSTLIGKHQTSVDGIN